MLYSTGLFTLEMLKILARSNIKGESLEAPRSNFLKNITNVNHLFFELLLIFPEHFIKFIAFPVILFRQINTGCLVTTD